MKNKNKRRHKKSKKAVSKPPPLPTIKYVEAQPKKTFSRHFWEIIAYVSGIGGIISFIAYFNGCFHEVTSKKEELWKDRNYISGINIPMNVSESSPYINIKTGGVTQSFPISFLKKGLFYHSSLMILPGGCTPFNLDLILKNNNIYAATTFKDIDGKYVGKMDFDHWEARDIQIANFYNHDSIMELMDIYQHVLFSMKYIYPNTIEIKGYFNTDSCLEVDNLITKSFPKPLRGESKTEAEYMIGRIKPIHTY